MSLVEITAVDADASSPSSLSLFVVCNRIAPSLSSTASIGVHLILPLTLYEAEVSSCQKPKALECSGVEYVEAVETALGSISDSKARFELRWSRTMHTLTLMERSEFAVKFGTVQFQVANSNDKWRMLLHQVAMQQEEKTRLIDSKCSRIIQLETLLEAKEALLETALAAKQSTEDRLVQGFCAVLNAKKDEIRRLQGQVEHMQRLDVAPVTKRKPVVKRRRRATGAKLKQKEAEHESDEGSEEPTGSDNEENDLKRAKREAISAYSQLPSNGKPSAMQISSAEDLLSSMDDLIKQEEEVNEATQRGDCNEVNHEPTGQAKAAKDTRCTFNPNGTEATHSASSSIDAAMDSEEEAMFDMLA